MKKTLVIGSAVADVIINLPHLPATKEDVHVLSQKVSLGGCAYNASDILRHFQVPYIPFFPVGSGIYGEFVRSQFAKKGIQTPIPPCEMENGCCYCFVESDGERTFAALHGAEYLFDPSWFDLLDPEEIGQVYICGLEIEESTGPHIVDYLEQHPKFRIFFAPGPRLTKIDPMLLHRILALHPILHLNEEEVIQFYQILTGETPSNPVKDTSPDCPLWRKQLQISMQLLSESTNAPVIVTLGERGSCYYTKKDGLTVVPGVPAVPVDTIGAGDSHIGAIMACLQKEMSLNTALSVANRVSARVVETTGALLSESQFVSIMEELQQFIK